jgi:ABC-2 type transport system ATP-binding protein
VPVGSTFGITGNNGSGKSTLLKCIARILVPNHGTITTRGTIASILELGSGFHPELSGRENVYLNASVMRIPRHEIESKYDALVEFSGIGDFIEQPVKTYSSGMYMRLAFSVASHIDPDILLVDEVIAVGDSDFQEKCLQKFDEMKQRGRTVIIASGALGTLERMCDEVGRLDHGKLVDLQRHDRTTDHADAAKDLVGDGHSPIIAGVDILDSRGVAIDQVSSGESVTLRLRYHAEEPVPQAVFVLELRTLAGVRAWVQNSRGANLMPDPLVASGSIDLDIPRLALQAGKYEVRAAVADDAMCKTLEARSFGAPLEVTNESLSETMGLAVLDGRWSNPLQTG